MIKFEEALKIILTNSRVLPAENIYIADSCHRVIAEDIYAKIPMPPFDKSAMDGFALKTGQIKAGVKLKCIGLIQAGDVFKRKIKPDECVKIMTGAALPLGMDAVIMVEDTRELKNRMIEFLKPVVKGQNICVKGEDISRGQKLLAKGALLSSSHIALIASAGRKTIKVYKRPEVAILNTGAEIVPVGEKITRNKIYNSNGPMLEALLKDDNIKAGDLGIAKDKKKDLKKAISKGLSADVLLISGGVSMGDYDFVPAVLKSLGAKKLFYKISIKPGKPLLFCVKDKKIIFGIPGNPVSNFLSYLVFIRPALRKMMGYISRDQVFSEGIINAAISAGPDRTHFVLAKVLRDGMLGPVPSHGSADIMALANAGVFIKLEPGISLKKGAKVKCITWEKI